jgi:plastocyanin
MSPALRLALCTLVLSACADDEFQPPVIDAATVDAAVTDTAVTDATDGDAPDAAIDATPPPDAMTSVREVACTGNPAATIGISTGGDAFMPAAVIINANDVIRFDPAGTLHDMTSGTGGLPDGEFATTTSQVACLRFTQAGTFAFYCSIHGFTGTVTVN